jgi:hypothetical protein
MKIIVMKQILDGVSVLLFNTNSLLYSGYIEGLIILTISSNSRAFIGWARSWGRSFVFFSVACNAGLFLN